MENLYETKQDNQDYLEELKALGVDADKMWRAYTIHRNGCRNRLDRNGDQVLFLLTFEQWSQMWLAKDASGTRYWNNRGNKNASDYVMSRMSDLGHYVLGNVFIQTNAQNVVEAREWQLGDSDFCVRQSEARNSPKFRQKLSENRRKAFQEADADKKSRMRLGAKVANIAAAKALSKSINYYGTIYPSAAECARQVGLTNQAISKKARNPNNLNVFYL